ncbi:MAG: type II secretion system protein GspG [Verrucomicrobiota bacterium]
MKRLFLKWRGFTLVELLVVISIITILAALTLSTVGYANKKAAMDRARAEIAGLEVALESYKVDNGDYPRDSASTDNLDATSNPSVTIVNNAVPTLSGSASLVLYAALSADTDLDRTLSSTEKTAGRVYFPFKPNMLYPKCLVGGTQQVQAVVDPFRNVYGYSTIGSGTASTTTGTQAGGYNPTFDLWSTVDTNQTGTPSATWITNW